MFGTRKTLPALGAAAVLATVLAALLATALTGCSATPSGAAPQPHLGALALAATPAASTPTPKTTAKPTPKPKSNPCAANTHPQLVLVDISQQHLWMCAHHTLVKDTAVTTGAVDLPYDDTPKGTFHIQGRDRNATLTLNTGKQYHVKYWIPFQSPLFGFHDSSWQNFPYGSQKYRTQGSHGCVHMPLAAISYLYKWAKIGATVRIKA